MSGWLRRLAESFVSMEDRSTGSQYLRVGSWALVRGSGSTAGASRRRGAGGGGIGAREMDSSSLAMGRSSALVAGRWSASLPTAAELEAVRCVGGRRAVLALLAGLTAALGAEADRLMGLSGCPAEEEDREAAVRLTFLVSDVLDCIDDLDPS